MAVFSPDNHTIRETINVDYKTRMTNQEVVFINNDNVFQGTFQGKVNMTGGVLSAGDGETVEIKNATLKNVVLEDEEGKKVNLSEYSTALNDIETNLETISGSVETNKTDADEKIANLETSTSELVNKAREELSAYVEAKVTEIGGSTATEMGNIKDDLSVETLNREKKDTELEESIKTLKTEIDNINATTSGGIIFQNSISVFRTDTSFLTIFQRRGYEDDESLRNGFMYSVDLKDCDSVVVEGMDIENGDYLIIRTNSGSVLVKDIDVSYIVKIDAMDKKALENVVQSVIDEKTRAEGQEVLLGKKTEAENERAISVEEEIKKSVSDEVSNRQMADESILAQSKNYTDEKLGSYYSQEKTDEVFLKKEDAKTTYSTIEEFANTTGSIKDSVASEKSARETAVTNLTTEIGSVKESVSNEYARSVGVESKLELRIGTEETRAQKTENGLQTSIDKLTNDITSEVEARKTSISSVENKVSLESERAVAKENAIESKISENSKTITTLKESEKKLQDSITEITVTKIPEISKSIADETTRAKTEENQIRTDLGNAISDKVSSEESRAKTQEKEILKKIDEINSDITEANNSITTEKTRAEGAEHKINVIIDALSSNVLATASTVDSFNEELHGVKTSVAETANNMVKLHEETLAKIAEEKTSLATSISEETKRATDAENVIKEDLESTKKGLIGSVYYKGHVSLDSYEGITYNKKISEIFKDYLEANGKLDGDGNYTFSNGDIYWFTTSKFPDGYTTGDDPKVRIVNKDYVLIHNHNDVSVGLADVNVSTIDIISHYDNNLITKTDLVALSNEIYGSISTAKTDLIGKSDDLSSLSTIYGAKKYADIKATDAKNATVGTASDLSTASTIYGAKKYADAKVAVEETNRASAISTAKTDLIGKSDDLSSLSTIYGAKKYADIKATDAKNATVGTASDLSTASTIYGAKKYADAKVAVEETNRASAISTAKTDLIGKSDDLSSLSTIYGAKKYADAKVAAVNTSIASAYIPKLAIKACLSSTFDNIKGNVNDGYNVNTNELIECLKKIYDAVNAVVGS